MIEGDGVDDRDSEDEISEKRVTLRGSTLLSKMMNVIPVNERRGSARERLTEDGDGNYVYYKWLFHSVETHPHGMKVKEWQLQGGRDYMEDVIHIEYNLKNNLGDLLVCMFDGHGGRGCSEWLGNNFQAVLEKQWQKQETKDMRACLHNSYLKANEKVQKEKGVGDSGSTALVAIIRNNKIFVANAGDTRAVIFRTKGEERLTVDHRVNNPKELKRLKALDATIKSNRICVAHCDINIARAIGDKRFHPYVIPDPDFFEYRIEYVKFLLISGPFRK